MSTLRRASRHLRSGPWSTRRTFPADVLASIAATVKAGESRHSGEIRFAVEAALPAADVLRGMTPRERALEVFAHLGVWDTHHNNGVLIYVLLADRDVEIVADRGVAHGRVPQSEWEACCRVMEAHFAAGDFKAGSVAGIEAVVDVLARYPPDGPDFGNELPDAAVLL